MNDEKFTVAGLMELMTKREKELNEELAKLKDSAREADECRRQYRHQLLMLPIQLVLFPVMLLVKLFKWTYDYED